ncbi:MAG: TSUP family transporter [Gammaproteobacteria bacterium]|nr:TSUP family transporter [Gammaproteobacteria bacterium]MBU2254205.1 TSUP family transporter [Gammaproteobacteria bacterium]
MAITYSVGDCLAMLIVLCASLVQAWLDIGFALLGAPLLYLLNPSYVPGPVLMLGVVLAACMALGNRQAMVWRRPMPAIIARLPGAWCGGLLLGLLPSTWLGLLLGVCVLLTTVSSYRWLEIRCIPRNLAFAGFFSGLMGTATSVGGPPMALVYQTCERLSTRDELATFFLLTTPVSLLVLSYQNRLPPDYLTTSCKLVPAVLAGYGLARCFDNRIDRHSPRQLLLLLSLMASCWLLANNFWQLLS